MSEIQESSTLTTYEETLEAGKIFLKVLYGSAHPITVQVTLKETEVTEFVNKVFEATIANGTLNINQDLVNKNVIGCGYSPKEALVDLRVRMTEILVQKQKEIEQALQKSPHLFIGWPPKTIPPQEITDNDIEEDISLILNKNNNMIL